MLSSFNSFSRKFTSVYEPVTPICVLNPQTVSSGLPTGWTLNSGGVNFVNEGTRKYYKFPMNQGQGVIDRVQFNIPNVVMNYGTNGGYTHILAVRLNSTNNPLISQGTVPALVVQSGVPGFAGISTVNSGATCLLVGANGSSCPNVSTTLGKNKFFFIAHSLDNSTGQLYSYFEGKLYYVSAYTPAQNGTTSSGAYISVKTAWNLGASYGVDCDVLYFAHYDRPLSQNDIKKVFNSIAPLLEIGTESPLFTTATSFSALNVPSTPLFEFNAFNYTQTNGQSYLAGTTGWNANAVQNLYWGVDTIGRRYINFNQNFASITKNYTVNSAMYTNQGYTVAMILRVNNFTNGGKNALFTTGLTTFYLNDEYITGTTLVTDNFNYLCAVSSIGGQTDTNTAYLAPTSFSLNKFMLVCYVMSGSTASVYINNKRMSQKTVPTLTGGDTTGLATSATLGLSHNNVFGTPTNSVDFMYASFYDRALTTTEMTSLFNSCNMLLDI